jgi:HK97 gp10 family phage protein
MPFKVRMRIKGVEELIANLRAIDDTLKKKALQKGVTAGSKIVARSASARVHRRSGQLAKSIGAKVKTYRGSGKVVGIIGPRQDFKIMYHGKPVDPVRYAHLVEYGTVRSRAFPFLRPALDENQQAVYGAIAEAVKDALNR